MLNEVDVEDCEPTYVVGKNKNIMRDDIVGKSYVIKTVKKQI